MPRGTTKRRPETQSRLLEAAREVFADVGFFGASIGDICKRAGYTTGAFYSNYASKDELFLAVFDANARRVTQRMARMIAKVAAADLTVERAGAILADVEEEDRTWFLISTEFTLYAVRHPEAARRLAEHEANLRVLLIELFSDIFARLGRSATVDIEEFVRLIVAVREGGLAQSYVEPRQLRPGHLDRTFFPLLLRAASVEAQP